MEPPQEWYLRCNSQEVPLEPPCLELIPLISLSSSKVELVFKGQDKAQAQLRTHQVYPAFRRAYLETPKEFLGFVVDLGVTRLKGSV